TATVCHNESGYIGLDTYDVLTQRVVSHHFHFGEGTEAELFRTPHRYIWPAELDLMGQLAGFTLESRPAGWSGGHLTAGAGSHVSVYRRAGGKRGRRSPEPAVEPGDDAAVRLRPQ